MTYADAIVEVRKLWNAKNARLGEAARDRAAVTFDHLERARLTIEIDRLEREADALAAALDALTRCPERIV